MSRFVQNYLTVSAMDGNWTADESVRSDLASRLARVLSSQSAGGAPLRIVLTNDDGFASAGLRTMYNALVAAKHEVVVVAPMDEENARGTALSLSSFYVTQYSQGFFVGATPATVIGTALGALLTSDMPDLVIAGINDGDLVGPGRRYSGTAGAIQATIIGYDLPVISVAAESAAVYGLAANFTVELIADLQDTMGSGALLADGTGLSANVPDAAASGYGVAFTVNDQAAPAAIAVTADGGFPGGTAFVEPRAPTAAIRTPRARPSRPGRSPSPRLTPIQCR